MPEYDTPTPIDLAIDLPVGSITLTAADVTSARVSVDPADPAKAADQRAAAETRVEFDGGRLVVTGPRPRVALFGPNGSVDVTVELPTGSRLAAELGAGGIRASGLLGASRIKSALGAVVLDETGDLWLRSSHGNVTVASVHGSAEVTLAHGQIRLGAVEGDSKLSSSHGSVSVDLAGGVVEATTSYGDLELGQALDSVTAKTAYGSVSIGRARHGALQLETGFGGVAVGVAAGTPAWLDLDTKMGRVRNDLATDAAPADTEQSVSVRARTKYGDVTITRAA